MAYKKSSHPGVTVTTNRHGNPIARWKDYDTDAVIEQSLGSLGFASKTAALPWLRMKSAEVLEQKRRVKTRGKRPNVAVSLQETEKEYLEEFSAVRGTLAAERTRRDWLRLWRAYCLENNVQTAGDVATTHLRKFRISLSRSLAPPTRNRHLGAVKAFLSWARRNGYLRISKDDVGDQLAPYPTAKKLPRVLELNEIKALISAVVKHDQQRHFASREDKQAYFSGRPVAQGAPKYPPLAPFAFLGLLTGARPSEVLAIKWEHVKFGASEIEVWGNKTACERRVPLHDSRLLVKLLKGLQASANGSVHVCGDWADGKPREINDRQWKQLVKLIDPPFHLRPKDLRSTAVAYVASASPDSEYLLESRYGHGERVSKKHYRRPLHGLRERGSTVEQWLGVATELLFAMSELRLLDEPFIRRRKKIFKNAS
ncbi:MAG: hypothetical protein IT464_12050 [Planctomycetes bacterium]|nr:hypothetical protein [Planctomycetota bacterium]